MKSAILLSALMLCCGLVPAQISTVNPFPTEQEATSKLFNLEERKTNYHFTAEQPGSNFIIIEWEQLSTWHDKGDLTQIIATAKKYYAKVQDSFKGSTSAKRMDIHIPINNEPATVMIYEQPVTRSTLLINGNMQSPLKMNMDTIRVLKTVSEKTVRKENKLMQMQYTFLLKDIDQINTIGNDNATLGKISNTFDSVALKYRNRWFKQDKWTHNLSVTYHPLSDDPKKRLDVKKAHVENYSGRFYKAASFDAGLGITLFHNTLCPLIDVGYSYKWPSKNVEYSYIRLSETFLSDFRLSGSGYTNDQFLFFNLEYGWLKNRKNTYIPIHGAAFGFGYCHNPKDNIFYIPYFNEHIFRTYVSYRVTKYITVNLDNFDYLGSAGTWTLSALVRFWP